MEKYAYKYNSLQVSAEMKTSDIKTPIFIPFSHKLGLDKNEGRLVFMWLFAQYYAMTSKHFHHSACFAN